MKSLTIIKAIDKTHELQYTLDQLKEIELFRYMNMNVIDDNLKEIEKLQKKIKENKVRIRKRKEAIKDNNSKKNRLEKQYNELTYWLNHKGEIKNGK